MSTASPVTPTRPIRVLHVVGKMDRGGVETWLMNVLRNVSRDELAFDFMVHKPDVAAYDEELLMLGAGRYVCKWPSNPLMYARNFLRILREQGPYDVVHSHVHHFSGFVLLLAKLAGVPIRVAHSHSDASMTKREVKGARQVYFLATELLIKLAATSGIAVSAKAAASLFGFDWQRDERFAVIHCGINFSLFEQPVDRDNIRMELKIPKDAFVIGHVGRFDEVKNHDRLIDIFEIIHSSKPESILLLIGDGKLKQNIKNRVNSSNIHSSVIFLEPRNDIARLMKGAMDIFVFPSKFEGLGLALVEAQAAGLPCIASDSISDEAIISDNCEFISLNLKADVWSERILSMSMGNKLNFNNSFDLTENIAKLSKIYGVH